MKKLFIILALLGVLILPKNVLAASYVTNNLDEVLTQEEIEHDFSNYEETDDQITIYLFRGNGCTYCKKFLTFINSIIDEYGQYFKVVAYETWSNPSNKALMNKVGAKLGTTVTGVPFIVIGNQYFPGYMDDYAEPIKKAIVDLYESKDRYDVMEELGSSEDEESGKKTYVLVILVVVVIIAIGFYMYSEIKKEKKA